MSEPKPLTVGERQSLLSYWTMPHDDIPVTRYDILAYEATVADLERQAEKAQAKLGRVQDMCDFIIKEHQPLDMIRLRFEQVQEILRAAEER